MKIGDLNVGDLLKFDYEGDPPAADVGIVVEIAINDEPLVAVHWIHEQGHNPCWHGDREMNDWLGQGVVKVCK